MAEAIAESRSSQYISQRSDDESVVIPERVPWSQLAQDFAETWGRSDPEHPQPESVEVLGIQGSGKTYWVCKAVQERMIVRRTPCIILQSKPDDETIINLGWPIYSHGEYQKALKDPWCVYWPQTNALGRARRVYQADAFRNLLDRLWRPQANTIVVWDDIGYIQSLFTSDGESLNSYIEMFLREGRSVGLTNVLVKQRPQGAKREMHSETKWTVAYKPKDEDDQERFAQIMGNKKRYLPIFQDMDLKKHEFLIKHFVSDIEYISWVDTDLRPLARPKKENAQREQT